MTNANNHMFTANLNFEELPKLAISIPEKRLPTLIGLFPSLANESKNLKLPKLEPKADILELSNFLQNIDLSLLPDSFLDDLYSFFKLDSLEEVTSYQIIEFIKVLERCNYNLSDHLDHEEIPLKIVIGENDIFSVNYNPALNLSSQEKSKLIAESLGTLNVLLSIATNLSTLTGSQLPTVVLQKIFDELSTFLAK